METLIENVPITKKITTEKTEKAQRAQRKFSFQEPVAVGNIQTIISQELRSKSCKLQATSYKSTINNQKSSTP